MRLVPALVSLASVAAVVGSVSSARADDCPEGDWFCEPSAAPPPTPPPPPDSSEPSRAHPELPPPGAELPESPLYRRRILLEDPNAPRGFRRPRRFFHRWGFGVHAFGALLGNDSEMASNASMGGVGVGLRYRVIPEFALEGDVEFGFGTDYNGRDRREAAFLFHAIGVFNPRSVVRVYVFGGFGLSSARVAWDTGVGSAVYESVDHYSYVGMDLGLGAEVRVTPRTGIHFDLMSFVRDRTDASPDSRPEFYDPKTGRTSDTSGGALLRIGAVFYW